jgi:hypothetical protein
MVVVSRPPSCSLPHGQPTIAELMDKCSDPCIRGHRATKCEHWDRVMVRVKKPGRPLQTCPHGSAKPNCGCGREKVFMIKVSMEGGKCVCRVKQRANEFNHPVGDKFDTTVSQKGGLYTSCEGRPHYALYRLTRR